MPLSATVASRIICRNTGDRQAPKAWGRPQPASHHASRTTLWDAGLLFPSFLSKRSSLCDKKKQLMSPQKKLVSAWIRLHSLAGTLGAVLHAARENKGPNACVHPTLELGDIWSVESRDRAADSLCVGFALCCLFWREQRFPSDMSLNKYRRGLVWISLGSFPTPG